MGRLMRRRSTTTDDKAAPAPAPEPETAAERRCCRLRDAALSRNVRVRFLFDEIAKLGCDVGSPFGFVRCASVERSGPLGDKMVGGFAVNDGSQKRYAPGVVVVAEHAPDKAVFDRTLVHELARVRPVPREGDWKSGAHHAAKFRKRRRSPASATSRRRSTAAFRLDGTSRQVRAAARGALAGAGGRAEPEATVDAV